MDAARVVALRSHRLSPGDVPSSAGSPAGATPVLVPRGISEPFSPEDKLGLGWLVPPNALNIN